MANQFYVGPDGVFLGAFGNGALPVVSGAVEVATQPTDGTCIWNFTTSTWGPSTLAVYIPTATVLGRLTLAEYTAIKQAAASQLAAGNGQLEQWLDMARTSINGINPADPATIAAIAALESANLLTAARAAVVFAAA